jgi:hypothetical protein
MLSGYDAHPLGAMQWSARVRLCPDGKALAQARNHSLYVSNEDGSR